MGWIGKLFSGDTAPAPAAATTPHDWSNGADAGTTAEVDAIFYRWLAPATLPHADVALELRILTELTRLAQSPIDGAALVPRVPDIIPRLMRTLRDDDMNAADLSRQLAHDVVLVAEVLREANRPCYRPRYHAGAAIDSMAAAIMLLGQNGMRMLLARVAFRPIISMQNGRLAKRSAPQIWRQSEKSALAASLLAAPLRANAFEAYLAGLLENVGLVVAFRLIDQICADGPQPQSDAFIKSLFVQARGLSAQIATLWEFPAAVVSAIGAAGAPDTPLAEALALGDRLSKLRMLVDAVQFSPDDPFVIGGMNAAQLACFDKLIDEE